MVVRIVVSVLIVEVAATVGAFQETGKHIFFNVLWLTVFCAAKGFLDILP
jgi:hypothetical protein